MVDGKTPLSIDHRPASAGDQEQDDAAKQGQNDDDARGQEGAVG